MCHFVTDAPTIFTRAVVDVVELWKQVLDVVQIVKQVANKVFRRSVDVEPEVSERRGVVRERRPHHHQQVGKVEALDFEVDGKLAQILERFCELQKHYRAQVIFLAVRLG
ncbi:UNVERIFIED_CONTAM: hypothetical protein ACS92_07655 [Bacillus cereus]